jgi:alpha,alpha-trehalase
MRSPSILFALALALASACASTAPSPSPGGRLGSTATAGRVATDADVAALLAYVDKGWTVLQRSHAQLPIAAADPKMPTRAASPVYVSAKEDLAAVRARLSRELAPAELARIELRRLPADPTKLVEHGLLYLPGPYVVPGGRFNEMYGWDSYFILVGLLRDGKVDLARSMVDNFVYQIEHYGTILNANRTYYLTRSQPPFLTPMIRAVYARTGDRAWLARTVPAIEAYYAYWMREPHLVPATGLSRYYDVGSGPAPEVASAEKDASGMTHYDRVRAYYRDHEVTDYDEALFYDPKADRLTDLFYVADRAMRESGFDPSSRFGMFNAGVIFSNPVCLNTLLWVMENDAAAIATELGQGDPARWKQRAAARKVAMDRYLWDEQRGTYLDYDFQRGARRDYPFGTMFFPLWAGLASEEQARRVATQVAVLEQPGGLATSTQASGTQWDLPYGWAPLELVAVEGLRRYGLVEAADRISVNFLSLVLKEFLEHDVIFEKYDVVERESATEKGIRFGYSDNVIGFGWTNAAWTAMYDALSPEQRARVKRLSGVGVGVPAPRAAVPAPGAPAAVAAPPP